MITNLEVEHPAGKLQFMVVLVKGFLVVAFTVPGLAYLRLLLKD